MRARVLSRVMPALCTRMSTPPWCSAQVAGDGRRGAGVADVDQQHRAADRRAPPGWPGRRRPGGRGRRRGRPPRPGGGRWPRRCRGRRRSPAPPCPPADAPTAARRCPPRVPSTSSGWPVTKADRADSRKRSTGSRRFSAPGSTVTSCAVAPRLPISLARLRTKPSSAASRRGLPAAWPPPATGDRAPAPGRWRASAGSSGWKKSYSARSPSGVSMPVASNTSASARNPSGSAVTIQRPRGATVRLAQLAKRRRDLARTRCGLAPAATSVRASTGPSSQDTSLPAGRPSTIVWSASGRSSQGPLARRRVCGIGIGRPSVFTSLRARRLPPSCRKKSLTVHLHIRIHKLPSNAARDSEATNKIGRPARRVADSEVTPVQVQPNPGRQHQRTGEAHVDRRQAIGGPRNNARFSPSTARARVAKPCRMAPRCPSARAYGRTQCTGLKSPVSMREAQPGVGAQPPERQLARTRRDPGGRPCAVAGAPAPESPALGRGHDDEDIRNHRLGRRRRPGDHPLAQHRPPAVVVHAFQSGADDAAAGPPAAGRSSAAGSRRSSPASAGRPARAGSAPPAAPPTGETGAPARVPGRPRDRRPRSAGSRAPGPGTVPATSATSSGPGSCRRSGGWTSPPDAEPPPGRCLPGLPAPGPGAAGVAPARPSATRPPRPWPRWRRPRSSRVVAVRRGGLPTLLQLRQQARAGAW